MIFAEEREQLERDFCMYGQMCCNIAFQINSHTNGMTWPLDLVFVNKDFTLRCVRISFVKSSAMLIFPNYYINFMLVTYMCKKKKTPSLIRVCIFILLTKFNVNELQCVTFCDVIFSP